jgi:pyrroline-5-carboxylate reductase
MSAALAAPAAIGFVGVGNMGRPMAARLVAAGYALEIFDIDRRAAQGFVERHGGRIAPSLAALGQASEAVITMLPDANCVREAVLSADGAASGLAAGSLVIDMSSCDPTATRGAASRSSMRLSRAASSAPRTARSRPWSAARRRSSTAPCRSCAPWRATFSAPARSARAMP